MERGWVRPRPALDRRLDGALTHRLTCLVATTGYGKSTALTGWGQAVGAVLHRLGPADRDLPTLAGTVAAALSAKVPGLPADLLTAAAAPLGPDADELSKAAALAGALAEALAQRLRRGWCWCSTASRPSRARPVPCGTWRRWSARRPATCISSRRRGRRCRSPPPGCARTTTCSTSTPATFR
ncbi:hypothetical protein ACFQ0B_11220 [Nonomuraea thailandensis]